MVLHFCCFCFCLEKLFFYSFLFYLAKTVWLFVSSFKRSLRTKLRNKRNKFLLGRKRRRSLWKYFLEKRLCSQFHQQLFNTIFLEYTYLHLTSIWWYLNCTQVSFSPLVNFDEILWTAFGQITFGFYISCNFSAKNIF